jgi:hypothetical protein
MRQPVQRVFVGLAGGGVGRASRSAAGFRARGEIGGVAGQGRVAGLERVVGEQAEGHGVGFLFGAGFRSFP